MDQQERLATFKHAVFQEIDEEVEAIRREADAGRDGRLARTEEEQRRLASAETQRQIQELQKEFRRDTAKYSLEVKRSILERRNALLEQVIASAEERLLRFRQSKEYPAYLLERVKAFGAEHPLPDAEILVEEGDLPLAERIQKAYGLPCTVRSEAGLELGGFLVRGGAALYDESVRQRLSERKTRLLEESTLALAEA